MELMGGVQSRFKQIVVPLLILFLSGCAGLEPAQPPDTNIPATHLFGVTRLAFNPSGHLIASGGYKGDVAIWNVPKGELIDRFQWHQDSVRGLVWIDGRYLASAGEEGRVVITNLTAGTAQRKIETLPGLTALAFLPATKLLVTGYADGAIRVFSYPSLQPVKQLKLDAEVVALAVDHAGRQLAVSTEDEHVLMLDQDLEQSIELQQPSRTALELRFSPDDRTLVAGAWYELFYWDLSSGRIRAQETEHWGAITSLDYRPQGDQLITLGRHTDANLRLIDSASGSVKRRLQGHRLCGAAVRFSPDGRYVASGSDDESIRFYDLNKPYVPQRVGDSW
ncbi:MAG: WD40 repeat domain-containing protein [Sedimenticola thiotaurini]|uniref:WD40 repeat domain-containing protein n=1 Tax=Sedimenticola thiotaurini TaxID=1543721 RepID=A0A558D790_9GAMM|nr:MAG: WD40 repeat domain-containing protein [Sedimenticola thiotaurini]